MQKFILYTDGGSRGNPGIAGAGIVVANDQGKTIKTKAVPLGVATNNEAEYLAVIHGLDVLKKALGKEKLKTAEIELRLDSELVAKQLRGEYQIKDEKLYPLFIKIWNMQVKDLPKISVTHVLRNKNKQADELANEAMDMAKGNKTIF